MVTFVLYSDFVDVLATRAQERQIQIDTIFNYYLGPCIQITCPKIILQGFLDSFGFLIEETKQLKGLDRKYTYYRFNEDPGPRQKSVLHTHKI